eukprot:ANDGO_00025.mRNA.1 putative Golgi transport protein 1
MMHLLRFDDNKKIGMGLTMFGLFFMFLGVLLFFDAGLLAMGNILFLSGITFLIGFSRTIAFFARPQKWKGSAMFGFGFLLVLWKWALIGMVIEAAGFVNLFGDFLPTVWRTVRSFPVLDMALRVTGLRRFFDSRLSSSFLPS